MRRRSFLGALAAGAALTAAAPAALGRTRTERRATELDPTATLDAPGVSEAVVGDDGRYVYGAAQDSLLVADFEDPSAPTTVTEAEPTVGDDALTGVQDVAVSGDRALVAGPPGFLRDGQTAGAALFDVSDPTDPEQVAAVPTDHAVHNLHLDGDTAYLTGSRLPEEPVLVYDVGDDSPEPVAEWSVVDAVPEWGGVGGSVYQCHDVVATGDRLYVAYWDAGTWILDVSDRSDPTPVASIGGVDPEDADGGIADIVQLPGNSHYARPSPDGDLLAVGREAWDRDRGDDRYGGPGSIDLYDVSDETDPSFLAALRPPVVEDADGDNHVNTAHNFGFRGRRLYASWYTGGVRVYDLSAPTDPETLGWWAAPGDASFWTARPIPDGFVASSVTDPSAGRDANENYAEATLYAFPEPDGDAAASAETLTVDETGMPESPPDYDLPATSEESETTDAAATTDAAGTTPQRTTAQTTGDAGTTGATPDGTTATGSTPADDSTGGGVPGFGVGAAVAGGALAAYHRVRSGDEQ
ncbi:LVIVD repeat-containing protein [Halobacterium yunchengense]|uniref:LVIVD repeat-containing protein n=1 Tax=Halobacterium yunchengense TaxID=3108497 RepID=UPI003009B636